MKVLHKAKKIDKKGNDIQRNIKKRTFLAMYVCRLLLSSRCIRPQANILSPAGVAARSVQL